MKRLNQFTKKTMSSMALLSVLASATPTQAKDVNYNFLRQYKDVISHKYILSSSFHKERKMGSKKALAELKEMRADFLSNSSIETIMQQIKYEQKDVCVEWEKVKSVEKNKKKSSYSNRNLDLQFGLSTAAAAGAAGLTGFAGVMGGGISLLNLAAGAFGGLGGFAGFSGFAGGYLDTDLSGNYSSVTSNEEVSYYKLDESFKCSDYEKYVRASVAITPNLLSMNPQLAAEILDKSVATTLAEHSQQMDILIEILHALSNLNTFYTNDNYMIRIDEDLRRIFEGTEESVYLIDQEYIAKSKLEAMIYSLGTNMTKLVEKIERSHMAISKNQEVADIYSFEFEESNYKFEYLIGLLKSFDNTKIGILVDHSFFEINNSKLRFKLSKFDNDVEMDKVNLEEDANAVKENTVLKLKLPSVNHLHTSVSSITNRFDSIFEKRAETKDYILQESDITAHHNWAKETSSYEQKDLSLHIDSGCSFKAWLDNKQDKFIDAIQKEVGHLLSTGSKLFYKISVVAESEIRFDPLLFCQNPRQKFKVTIYYMNIK